LVPRRPPAAPLLDLTIVRPIAPVALFRLASIGVVLIALVAAFAFVAGWFSPDRLNASQIVDALQIHDGLHPGFRRAHAKGICIEGRFLANGNGAALSRAAIFTAAEAPVIGRFSTGGGQPYAPDGRPVFHAIALSFSQPDGQLWRTAMDDTPIFFVATPHAFREFQLATAPDPATGKPDPARSADFLANHPETRAFFAWMRDNPLPSSFANGTYYSINAFRFSNAASKTRHVRWSLVPETPFTALDETKLASLAPNFLFEDLVERLMHGPLRWHLMLSVAQPGDPVADATRAWPADRQQVDAGTLVIGRATTEEEGACRDITFDPLILPDGISPSADPLLAARSAVYAASLARRDGEPAAPSAAARDPIIRRSTP
jgi:catalase